MPLVFRNVSAPGLIRLEAESPDGVILGLVGECGSGAGMLLRLAAGHEAARAGRVEAPAPRLYLGPQDPLDLPPARLIALDHALALRDRLERATAAGRMNELRRSGAILLLASHEEDLLLELCDEIWWLQDGALAARGDPGETLAAYRRHIAQRLRARGDSAAPLDPRMRRGDGRARIEGIEILGEPGRLTTALGSGELAVVRVSVRFERPVADPVIGILIRTRIGVAVYGTNTELEGLKLGPRAAGDRLRIEFAFRCELCPQLYTLTAASHDPDGVWHDWLDEAVSFTVVDDRYTAGVANLRARVTAL
ncbi:MAG: hypothetical protein FJW37_10755 [Acidobacteria bacterium]|nr:hypothetical protein [Acidobacteriota bacterium]